MISLFCCFVLCFVFFFSSVFVYFSFIVVFLFYCCCDCALFLTSHLISNAWLSIRNQFDWILHIIWKLNFTITFDDFADTSNNLTIAIQSFHITFVNWLAVVHSHRLHTKRLMGHTHTKHKNLFVMNHVLSQKWATLSLHSNSKNCECKYTVKNLPLIEQWWLFFIICFNAHCPGTYIYTQVHTATKSIRDPKSFGL